VSDSAQLSSRIFVISLSLFMYICACASGCILRKWWWRFILSTKKTIWKTQLVMIS